MAFNLLVELSSQKSDWNRLNENLKEFISEHLEFFPIPDLFDINKNYVGISVVGKNFSDSDIDRFITAVKFLLTEGHKVIELYSSKEFSAVNTDQLAKSFLR